MCQRERLHTPRWSIPRNFWVRGKGTFATTKPVKKKLTHAIVAICDGWPRWNCSVALWTVGFFES